MEEMFKNPVQFSKGIDLKELISSRQSEFHIDMDFKGNGSGVDLAEYGDMMADPEDNDDDSDNEDVFKNLEDLTEQKLLASPEYHSFEDLAAMMVECRSIPSGAVKIRVLEEGDGPLVPPDAEVMIQYAAYWEKTTIPFDSTVTMGDGSAMRVRLGVGKFLPGIELALANVKGPRARFLALLQPAVMWGEMGALPRIRPEPALFVIVLDHVSERAVASTFNELPLEEQTKFEITKRTIDSIRNTAKEQFKRQRYNKAIKQYQQAMSVLLLSQPQTPQEEKEIQNMKVKMYVNLAVCYYKLDKPKYVLMMCENIDKLIDIETHCKSLYYCGKANELLGKREEAVKYYIKALRLEPKNKELGNLLADLEKQIKVSGKKEADMWKKAFKTETSNKIEYHVDDDFENVVREMCNDLASRNEYAKFDLPVGTSDELLCIKSLVSQFEGLLVEESGQGKGKKVSIIKKSF